MNISESLRQIFPVSEETIRKLESVATLIKVQKRRPIVTQGERTDSIFIINTGLFRVSFCNEDKEDTICFGLDGDPFTSVHSWLKHEPSKFSCIALTDSLVYQIKFADFEQISKEQPDLVLWTRNLLIEQIYAFEKKYSFLGTCNATTRYEQFLKLRPEIFNKIPIKYIAQYLKISPETLSRIRSKIAKNNKQLH